MYSLANPQRFMRLSGRVLPFLAVAAAFSIAVGLIMAFTAPPDFRQGETVRIMYIHVPSAWLAMLAYMMIAIAGLGVLIWRHPLADVAAKAAAPLGAAFTFLALVTGSLWGKPMWGTYWQWDARMTSMLVLLFLYFGLMALRGAIEDASRASRVTAILALVGAVNIPIIKFSVDWWETLHQPASVFRADGPTIHPDLLWPLAVMALGFTLLFLTLHLAAMRNEILRRKAIGLQLRRVDRAATAMAT
jgi:heme exporter protein C